jgi:hypothetical protein
VHLDDEKQDIECAFRVLEFAIRTMCYFEVGKVDIASFGSDIGILLEQENAGFSDDYFLSMDNAVIVSHMNVGAAFGTTAIALAKLFEKARARRDFSSDEATYSLWCLVYAIRNAFAHEIGNPRWVVKEKYRRKLRIALGNGEIEVDLAKLNGQNFDYDHIGGFANWQKIKDESFKLLSA